MSASDPPGSHPARRPSTPHVPTGRQRAIAHLVRALVLAVAATQRFRVHDPHGAAALARSRPVIFATWHNRLAMSMPIRTRVFGDANSPLRPMAALVSASRDGALLAAILQAFDVQPVRGSSSRRGSRALLELHDLAQKGYHLAITPDGPRGPIYSTQPGAAAAARLTGFPILPVAINLGWKVRLPSWDRFQIPLPAGCCEVVLAEPLWISSEVDDLSAPLGLLRQRLLDITRD